LIEHCVLNNLECLYPVDNALPANLTDKREIAAWIYELNLNLIQQADIVMANVNDFRG
jgi:nucleoside 2-deoxyribosyltransferase